jgi:hypothetical protein
MDNDLIVDNRSWWSRNWKWLVPSGCLTLLVLFGLFIGSIFYGVTSVMKNSDVYVHSLTLAKENEKVTSLIGKSIDADGMTTGNISTTNDSGEADLTYSVKGTKGKGSIHVIAHKENNVWNYELIEFNADGSNQKINLLENAK